MSSSDPRPERHWLLGIVARVLIAFAILAVITHTLVRPFVIPSGSMEPTLMTGDRVFATIVGVDEADLERGDIVVFGHGQAWEDATLTDPNPVSNAVRYVGDVLGTGPSHRSHTVKRVIGLPGERVSCCDSQGRVLVDGAPLTEPYVKNDLPMPDGTACDGDQPSARCFAEITVPAGSYLVLGDNRANSSDSVAGCRGAAGPTCEPRFVRFDQVVGTLGWRWWPLPPGSAERS
ncbi:MAG: signal peptidase I [Janibacter sp.]|nr:signal peptidase I [Janibacter sp.]